MIKINLLAGAQAPFEAKPEAASRAHTFQAQVLIVSLLLAAGVAGAFDVYWKHALSRLNAQLEAAKREAARLAAIQAENQQYQKELEEIERRINAIQALQSNRTGPVTLMATLGGTVNRTRDLYLTSVDAAGSRLMLQGASGTESAIADFLSVLKSVGAFSDVQIRQYYESDLETRVMFRFNIDCLYQRAAPGAAASTPVAAAR
jgi:Tfp pilus assembly protein PilN